MTTNRQAAVPSDGEPPTLCSRTSPVIIIVIGMAGCGKTTFVKSLHSHLCAIGKRLYAINLDPAVKSVPFPANIDIRDTVNYKEVMKQYSLGPNGAIMTSLNLFSTRFDQVLGLLEKRADELDIVLVDTPGQIEVFNWSASGALISEALAVSFPTVFAYVLDTPRCLKPVTFMSNMLYACSIMYKAKLPFLLCFNKIDVASHGGLVEWMKDADRYREALQQETSYLSCLSRSMSLVIEEFYNKMRYVGVSSFTGEGFPGFDKKIEDSVKEYATEYAPWVKETRSYQKAQAEGQRED